MFKRRHFPVEIILVCVRWYGKYGISYRDLTEMMQERGIAVDLSTIMRWVHRYAPELEKRVRRYQGLSFDLLASGRDLHKSRRQAEVSVPRRGQAGPVHRLHAVGSTRQQRGPSLSGQGIENDAATTAIVDHNGPAWFLSKGHQPTHREGKLSASTRHRTCKYLKPSLRPIMERSSELSDRPGACRP